MDIRVANLSDCKEVYELTKNTPELVNPSIEPPNLWWIESFIREKQVFYVAVEDNRVIGYILGERTSGNVGLMWMITVTEEFRGKGIGKKLLFEFENECRKRNLKAIVAYGYSNGEKVLNMLERNNYHKGNAYYEFVKLL